jgi:hypothetical protein
MRTAYAAALDAFTEAEDCSPVDAVQHNPLRIDIARRFGKTPAQVCRKTSTGFISTVTARRPPQCSTYSTTTNDQ